MWRFDAVRIRPTASGAAYLALVVGITLGAVNTGNNLVYMVLAFLLAGLLVSNVLAEWNLRNLRVTRVLPPEIFAGVSSEGYYILENTRIAGAAWNVEIQEVDGTGSGHVSWCPPRGRVSVPGRFVFPRRGTTALGYVRVGSSFPFGLLTRSRDVALSGEVLVYPSPRRGLTSAAPTGAGMEDTTSVIRADVGEFLGLRPYAEGDPVRRVHWPTSARVGAPMVVIRAGAAGDEVMVRVDPSLVGAAREEAIARATGQVEHHLAKGDAVGIELDGLVEAPRGGAIWRRALLSRLALAEPR